MAEALILLMVGGLMQAARSFVVREGSEGVAGTGLAFGFLLLSCFFAGRIFKSVGLPRLTGYLVAGIVAGPYVLDFVSDSMVRSLQLVNGIATCLIALTAGGELSWARVRPLMRTIVSVSVWATGSTIVLVAGLLMLLRPWVPFLRDLPTQQALVVASVCSVMLSANSPAVVTALLNETGADGPLSRTILGLVVIGDLVIIILFGVASSIAGAVFGGHVDPVQTVITLAWELFGSIAAGAAIGFLLLVYLRKVGDGAPLFVLLVSAVVAEVGRRIHLDPLIVMLTAGLFVENVAEDVASRLIHDIESASLPVYVVFFGLAGAGLHLDVFKTVALPAMAIVVVRGLGFFAGSRIATRRTQADPVVQRWTWAGLVPQAGLAIALALLLQRTFPAFGVQAGALALCVIATNELVAPVLLRLALLRSGEAGKRTAMEFAEARSSGVPPAPAGPPPAGPPPAAPPPH